MPKGIPGRTQVEKRCEICGATFFRAVGRNDHVRTCSPACGNKLRAKAQEKHSDRTCKTCGKAFRAVPSSKASYCSKECMYARNAAGTTRNCEHCGKEFRSSPSQLHVRTCSAECGYAIRIDPRARGVTHAVVVDGAKKYRRRPWAAAEHGAARRFSCEQAQPIWADKAKMQDIYREAQRVSRITGMSYHVDHIVPLTSKLVCGLHNEFNLQILPGQDNLRKHNRYWPDMP